MSTLKARTVLCVLIVVLATGSAFVSGCGLFEPSNVDPHPPTISNLLVFPTTLFTEDILTVSFSYFDDGADIESAFIRDKNAPQSYSTTTPVAGEGEGEVAIFPGTEGTFVGLASIATRHPGPHTMVLWVEDTWGSRSNELEFTIHVAI